MKKAPVFAMMSLLLIISGCSGTRPDNLGIKNGKLLQCPDSPNCVSSQMNDQEHGIKPLVFSKDAPAAWEKLITTVKQQPRVRIVKQDDRYLYAEFTSKLWRFVDDVEFYLVPAKNIIEVRSASRLGYSDMGVNRKRIESIRRQFESE